MWSTTAADLERQSRPAEITIDFGANPTVTDRADPPERWLQAEGQLSGSNAASVVTVPRSSLFSPSMIPNCIQEWKGWHYRQPEAFANIYAWSGAMATVSQVNGVDHTLGVGYGLSGGNGGWSQSGTQSISLGGGGEVDGVADATAYNKINYRDLGWTNYPECEDLAVRRLPINVGAVLTHWTYQPHVSFGTCEYPTQGRFWKDRGMNVTYAAGVDIGPINVSAQSGWTSESKVLWAVTRRTKLCGSTQRVGCGRRRRVRVPGRLK